VAPHFDRDERLASYFPAKKGPIIEAFVEAGPERFYQLFHEQLFMRFSFP
jgi:hypothetical protein